ncbi:hypothetical protein BBG47_24300 [Paenibacillus sp. KS1]|uniref:ABC transporter ATP-binding protein n=1 Tax=Paenibacillus sp. KS1 TaxID=1849249 RepID=UPI0008064A9E|nr:ABC transporter ATP-binding protein [Paenibacillus sp. KS1]OBY76957.1 hypothetical protein BBG47_24300 [Paenibacillus sp. KS1]
MNAITVNNVSKVFKLSNGKPKTFKERMILRNKSNITIFKALDKVTLTVKKGETIGLLGRNGSGKSTLLKLMTGILYPDSGAISMEGKVSSLLELGAGFHPDFTGRENIFMNAAILGLSKKDIKSKLEKIISFSELQEYIDNPVRSYSSGMYMRLAFSVAIMVEPDILLIDEVLAVGDAAFQQKCIEQLVQMKNKGTTIVIVSHDLGVMEKLCDRLIWIHKGVVKSEGHPKKTIDQYITFLAEQENERLLNEVNGDNLSKVAEDSQVVENSPNEEQVDNENRWGNKKIEITEVIINDVNSNLKYSFMTGDLMSITIKFKANKDVDKPIFGLGFVNSFNVDCYGTNTFIDRFEIAKIQKGNFGEIKFVINSLNLLAGTYYLKIAVHDENGEQFDYHDKMYSFQITSLIPDVGIARLPHEWVFKIK